MEERTKIEADNLTLETVYSEDDVKELRFKVSLPEALIYIPFSSLETKKKLETFQEVLENFKKDIQEYKINEYLSLKMGKNGVIDIWVGEKRFMSCTFLKLNISQTDIQDYDEINSIDEADELYSNELHGNPHHRENINLSREEALRAHASNLQAWYEHNYDTRLLHRSLSFGLLDELQKAGDPLAKKRFKEELALRLEDPKVTINVFISLKKYLKIFTLREFMTILPNVSNLLVKFNLLNEITEDFFDHNLSPEQEEALKDSVYRTFEELISLPHEKLKKIARLTHRTSQIHLKKAKLTFYFATSLLNTLSYNQVKALAEMTQNRLLRSKLYHYIYNNQTFPAERLKFKENLTYFFKTRLINAKPKRVPYLLKHTPQKQVLNFKDEIKNPLSRLRVEFSFKNLYFDLKSYRFVQNPRFVQNRHDSLPVNYFSVNHHGIIAIFKEADPCFAFITDSQTNKSLRTPILGPSREDEALNLYYKPRSIWDEIECKLLMKKKFITFLQHRKTSEIYNGLITYLVSAINFAKRLLNKNEDIMIRLPKTNHPLSISSKDEGLRLFLEPRLIYL